MRRLNLKVLGILAAALPLSVAGLYALHEFQSRRSADRLLEQAENAEAKGDIPRAVRMLERHLYYKPDNTPALARYGSILADASSSPDVDKRAWEVLQRALGQDASRDDVRRKLVDLGLALGRYAQVRELVGQIERNAPRDAKLAAALAACEEYDGNYEEAATLYRQAIEHDPTLVDAYRGLTAVLIDHLDQADEAGRIVDAMVEANDKSAQAHLIRAIYLGQAGRPDESDREVAAALELEPKNAIALRIAAALAADRSDWKAARANLERLIAEYPKDEKAYLSLMDVELAAGRIEAAQSILRRGLKELPDANRLRWSLGEAYLSGGDLLAADGIVKDLVARGYDRGRLRMLQGQIAAARARWSEAAAAFDEAAKLLVEEPARVTQCRTLQALCYQNLGEDEQQMAVLRRLDTEAGPAQRLEVARVMERAGKLEEALLQYRMVEPTPRTRLAVAGLLIRIALAAGDDAERWAEAERAVDEAARENPNSAEAARLRAELLLATDRGDQARTVLESSRESQPTDPNTWAALIALAYLEDRAADVPALIDAAAGKLGDRPEIIAWRARHLVREDRDGADEELARLGEGLDRFPAADRNALRAILASSLSQLGRHDRAQAIWAGQAESRPNDLEVQTIAFDLAMLAGDDDAQERALSRIKAIDPSLWRYSLARQIVDRLRRKQPADLDRARDLLAQVEQERPDWPMAPLCEAELEDLQGHDGAAIEKYLLAIERGRRDPEVIRRTLILLTRGRRYDEAQNLVATLRRQSILTDNASRLASEISLIEKDFDAAIAQAERTVAEGSTNPDDYIWLGQVLSIAGRKDDAEAPLRKAVELAEGDPGPAVTLVQYLMATGRRADAEAAVRQAEEASKSPSPADLMALAQAYEVVGHMDDATEALRRAAQADPDDPAPSKNLASLLIRRRRPREAEPILEGLIGRQDDPETSEWARRLLALALAGDVDEDRTRRAMELLDVDGQAKAGQAESTADLRARARVLASQEDDARRDQAIAILEELGRRDLNAEDQLLLAGLYETRGRWADADALHRRRIEAQPDSAEPIAPYVQALLRQKQLDQADPWSAKLVELVPDSSTAALLRALTLNALGQADKAAGLLKQFAIGHPTQLEAMAIQLERMGRVPEAEELFRRLVVDRRSGEPKVDLALAEFLGRQGRTAEALDLCEAALKTCPIEDVAAAAANILSAGGGPDQAARAERWIAQALARDKASVPLKVTLAVIYSTQRRLPQAEAVYRQILAQTPDDPVALNNLAWVLAQSPGKHEEALALIDRAIAKAGLQPPLLDTRGVVHLAAGRPEQALRDLRAAIDAGPLPPMLFHLAQAHHAANQPKEAREALEAARRVGLTIAGLDPLERPAYQQLVAALGDR